jgi:hypothetical protein
MDGGSLKRVYTKEEIFKSVDAENNLEEIFLKIIGRNQ